VLVPARPYRFFLQLWSRLRPRGMMRLLLAETSESGRTTLLAGSIFLMYGQSTHYAFTGCHTWALPLHVNDLLQWEAIQRAHQDGFRFYDFGEVAEDRQGLAEFKSKWCAKPIKQYRYYYPRVTPKPASACPDHGIPRSMAWLWEHIPLGWTEFLGRQIYGYL
jgi:Acetyltransferase (GNAT) domain